MAAYRHCVTEMLHGGFVRQRKKEGVSERPPGSASIHYNQPGDPILAFQGMQTRFTPHPKTPVLTYKRTTTIKGNG